jgi:opacity protein-like surface antigen
MKKSLLVSLALLASTSVMAEDAKNFAHIQYTLRDTIADDKADPNRQGVNFTLGRNIGNGITLDVGQQFRTEKLNSNNGESTNRLEAGASYQYGLTKDISLYTRGAIGEKFTSLDDYLYYSIEPGVKAQVTKDLTAKVGYRYRDAFNDTKDEKTNTVRFGAEYAIAKDQAVTLGVDRSYGASEFVGYNAGYVIKF